MSTASIDDTKVNREIKSSFMDAIAEKALIKALSSLQYGRLVLEHNGRVLEFGKPAAEAEVVGHIFIHHPSAFKDILLGGSIGAAEAYMLGSWSSSNLVDVVRLMTLNLEVMNKMDNTRPIFSRITSKIMHVLNANTQSGSRKNISAHYDLGNDFFRLFLDPTMMYSSAVFPTQDSTLEEASLHKLDIICKKLNLSEQDHLMEVGTGGVA